MPTLLLHNIGVLLTMNARVGDALGVIENAAIIFDGDTIQWVGKDSALPRAHTAEQFDCLGGVVMPGLIDCHTHLVFAGDRQDEFALRARGATYQEIMLAGGGIRHTMEATRRASQSELISLALPRLARMLSRGVTSIESKTGYGLSCDAELKTLEVMYALQKQQPIDIAATFLGAHATPPEFEGKTKAYVEHIVDDMIPLVVSQGIATACDVFVEKGAFSVDQGRRILQSALDAGLKCRVHAEQLSHFGGAKLAAELFALSASHLEYADVEDMQALAKSGVVAELLPVAQEFLGMAQNASGRALADAGVKVAVATDLNPGSAMCDDLHLAARLSVTRGGLTCEEALQGVTCHAATALGRDDIGDIKAGMKADVCVLAAKSPWELLYDWSNNPVRAVFKNGRQAYLRE
jgi:imidazolonepropionase